MGLDQEDPVAVFFPKDLYEDGWAIQGVAPGVLHMKGRPLEDPLKGRRLLRLDGSTFWKLLDLALEEGGEVTL